MINKIVWDVFKNTGDINVFLELKSIENLQNNQYEKDMQTMKDVNNINNYTNNLKVDAYENSQSKWDSNFRK